MKNKILLSIFIILIPIFLCLSVYLIINTTYLQKEFGISEKGFVIVAEQDTHGGFHGDGTYSIVLDCSDKKTNIYKKIDDWRPLPLSENLQLIMYGGVRDGMTYGYNLAQDNNIPIITNGYYCFLDRHSRAVDKYSDNELFNRHSFNFSLAIYDTDTDTLYYIREDT